MPSPKSKSSPKTNLAKNIISLRKKLGFTTAELAEAVGLSRTSMREIESGRVVSPSFINVIRLSRFFGVQPIDLFDADLSELPERETTLNYIQANFEEADWRYLINMVNGRRKDHVKEEFFKSIYSFDD